MDEWEYQLRLKAALIWLIAITNLGSRPPGRHRKDSDSTLIMLGSFNSFSDGLIGNEETWPSDGRNKMTKGDTGRILVRSVNVGLTMVSIDNVATRISNVQISPSLFLFYTIFVIFSTLFLIFFSSFFEFFFQSQKN